MDQWDGKSRGTPLGYRFFIFLIKHVSLSRVYKILNLVTYYYYIFSPSSRQSLSDFYRTVFNGSKGSVTSVIRRNFTLFGQTLVDRVAFLLDKGDRFTHTFENEQYLFDIQKQGKGGVLLSAHLGNWETAGNLLKGRVTPTINILMLDAEVESIKSLLKHQTGGSRFNIIPIREDLSHIFEINKVISRNELIAMHADRYVEGMRFIELPFFGRMARFPYGPFAIATKLKVPVTFVFAAKNDIFSYHLSATQPLYEIRKPEDMARLYVTELEKKVREYPEQWFNYFNFFSEESRVQDVPN
jgi:predicted LPLAT superfamily acyltransferase